MYDDARGYLRLASRQASADEYARSETGATTWGFIGGSLTDEKEKQMKAYPLRNVDDKLWKQVKYKAVEEEKSVREVIIAALREAVKK